MEHRSAPESLQLARQLAAEFAATAAERDRVGGTAKTERDRIRQSGLLTLVIPRQYGGQGANWTEALQVVRTIAEADSSLAHVLAYHYLGVSTALLFGTPEQTERDYRETVEGNLFWGNALNPQDPRTVYADGFIDGAKSFCSGSADSDRLVVSAHEEGNPRFLVYVIPTHRQGVKPVADWDNMGQRQTDSGTVLFEHVPVEPGDLLGPPGPGGNPFASLRSSLVQLILAEIYLGLAQGAFNAARDYVRTQTRPRPGSGLESPTQDPYILHHYGDLYTDLAASTLLMEQAEQRLQSAWDRGIDLTAEERGHAAVAVAQAKVFATRVALNTTARVFELMGARATSARYGFDRFWRNARTLTLHDPVDYKIRDLGEFALNDKLPGPGLYG